MSPRRKRMWVVGLIVLGVGLATFFALKAFQKNLLYFYTPSQVLSGEAPKAYPFRVGGLVVQGSLMRETNGVTLQFSVTDGTATIPVKYSGILPDLFREGQGIISIGRLGKSGVFEASEVLAKHDENYMPPEVAESLKNKGTLPQSYKDYKK
jgi:cytochrome c-type biogenesis protein CcmE